MQMAVIAIEYQGYSISGGVASEENLTEDALCVFDFLVHHIGIAPSEIILIGSSLGTAICINVAEKREDVGMMVGPLLLGFTLAY